MHRTGRYPSGYPATILHPLSLLSNGDLGWVHVTNFVVAGLLFLAGAVGMRRILRPGPGGTWGPSLIGALGVALVWGGVFVADPAHGFPPGTPAGRARPAELAQRTAHRRPVIGYWAPVAACFVFARRFRWAGQRGWAAYCAVTGLVSPILALAAFPAADFRLLFAGGCSSGVGRRSWGPGC